MSNPKLTIEYELEILDECSGVHSVKIVQTGKTFKKHTVWLDEKNAETIQSNIEGEFAKLAKFIICPKDVYLSKEDKMISFEISDEKDFEWIINNESEESGLVH